MNEELAIKLSNGMNVQYQAETIWESIVSDANFDEYPDSPSLTKLQEALDEVIAEGCSGWHEQSWDVVVVATSEQVKAFRAACDE